MIEDGTEGAQQDERKVDREATNESSSDTSWSLCVALLSCIFYISIFAAVFYSEQIFENSSETSSTMLLVFVIDLLMLVVLSTPLLILFMFLLNLFGVGLGLQEVRSTENPRRRSVVGLFINFLLLLLLTWFAPLLLIPL